MPDVGTTEAIASILPELEPVAGASLAINLVYLNLERFRYREKITNHAQSKLDELSSPTPATQEIRLYKELTYLAGLKKYDGMDNNHCIEGKRPPNLWAVAYRLLFEFHQDIYICFASSILAGLVFVVGVGHNIGALAFLQPISQGSWGHVWFWLLSLAMGFPFIFVLAGRWIVRKAQWHVNELGLELSGLLQEQAQKASVRNPVVQRPRAERRPRPPKPPN